MKVIETEIAGVKIIEPDVFGYKCDNLYCPASERGMRFDDPALGIKWPEVVSTVVLSDKDSRLPLFADIQPYEA